MLNEEIDAYQYRPRYNPAFVRRVLAKRREEARLMTLEREAAEREARRRAEEGRRAENKAAREESAVQEYRIIDLSAGSVRVPARTIIEQVSQSTGIPYAEIIGVARKRSIAVARMIAMYEVRMRRPDLSLPQIAKIFRKDHTTVLHAVRKVEAERTSPKQEW